MNIVNELSGLRNKIAEWKKQGHTIALVPTMGNLHDGHLSLLEKAKILSDKTVVSIFVNPIQFGTGEDYESYPSTITTDKSKLESNQVDLLFTPDLEELYPSGVDVDTRVNIPILSSILCGQFRPDHFSGVATVVSKLLINVTPDYAMFGEKDYQQLMIIQRMVSDLCIPTKIIGMPIIRDDDGLAMSSRNAYLTEEQRKLAPMIYQTLQLAADKLKNRTDNHSTIEQQGFQALENAGFTPEYFSVRRTGDLGVPNGDESDLSILLAAWLGTARLIDNIKIKLDG
ncbi:MAG: pantoate--beta-alanine ligase [Gammaproteobacteria bacterium]|jgi:pantoate--beta-alanine ligase